ncbi:MAG: cysteine synthase [Pseudomonadota bacterium]
MSSPKYHNTILELVGETPMVRINHIFDEFKEYNPTIVTKLESVNPGGSAKDRIGMNMIEQAEKAGRIKPGDTLVEPTSGNTGIGLAMAAAVKGYKMLILMPEKMSEEKRNMVKSFGAELILTPTEAAFDDPESHIQLAKKIAAERPNHHLLDQYGNPDNPGIHYTTTGPEIWQQTDGQIDVLVTGMGTGGTITGTAKYLKEQNPDIKIVGADPEGSIFTGEVSDYQVEGIGYDFYPDVFDPDIVDEMVRVSDKDSFLEARRMTTEEGIHVGGSTGTVLAATRHVLNKMAEEGALEGKTIVFTTHDTGRTYLSKIYNDRWMREQGFLGADKKENAA